MTYYNSKIFCEIFYSLNVSPIIYYESIAHFLKILNLGGERNRNLINITYDVLIYAPILTNKNSNMSYLYPRQANSYLIITSHKKVISFFEDVGSICSNEVIVVSVFICLITLIVLMFSKRLDFGSALFEILRIILSISTVSQFHKYSLKIFFASIFFLSSL